jgi:hypothetical protein
VLATLRQRNFALWALYMVAFVEGVLALILFRSLLKARLEVPAAA